MLQDKAEALAAGLEPAETTKVPKKYLSMTREELLDAIVELEKGTAFPFFFGFYFGALLALFSCATLSHLSPSSPHLPSSPVAKPKVSKKVLEKERKEKEAERMEREAEAVRRAGWAAARRRTTPLNPSVLNAQPTHPHFPPRARSWPARPPRRRS